MIEDLESELSIQYAIFDMKLLKAFAIIVSSFICHTNVVTVAGELTEPSERRSTKIAFRAAAVQVVFYLLIAVCGYLSFGSSVAQNFITNYPSDDVYITLCRIMLSITIFFGIPINTNPTAKAVVNLIRLTSYDSPLGTPLLPSTPSENSIGDMSRFLRILVSIIVVILGGIISLFVPGIADVIGLLGGSFGTLIMLVFPAVIYERVFELNKVEKVLVNVLFGAAAACFASVLLTVAGLI